MPENGRMRPGSKARKAIKLQPGDHVLIGRPGISLPADWFVATVLWADAEEMLTEHQPPSGQPERQRQVLEIDYARAVGTIAELVEFKHSAQAGMKEFSDGIHACEQALAEARAAAWSKLDELGLSRPGMKRKTS